MSELKAATGRVITKVRMNDKDSFTFENGTKIALQRNTERFDKNYTHISQGEVIDSDYIPKGATVYFHHNATHDTHRIFNYKVLNSAEIAEDIRYFSIPENQCFLWRKGDGEIQPIKGFVTALRVFKPYAGIMQGVEPEKLKNTLYVTSGELAGQVVRTLKACDYEIIFQNLKGREERIIRCRYSEDPNFWKIEYNELLRSGMKEEDARNAANRDEIIAIDHTATQKVINGHLFIGLTTTDCKPLNELYHVH